MLNHDQGGYSSSRAAIYVQLTLTNRPQHIAWLTLSGGQKMAFTPAKFNAGLNEAETTVVTRYLTRFSF